MKASYNFKQFEENKMFFQRTTLEATFKDTEPQTLHIALIELHLHFRRVEACVCGTEPRGRHTYEQKKICSGQDRLLLLIFHICKIDNSTEKLSDEEEVN